MILLILLGPPGLYADDTTPVELSFVTTTGTKQLNPVHDSASAGAHFEWEYPILVAGADSIVIDSLNRFIRGFWSEHQEGKWSSLTLDAWMDRWFANFGEFLLDNPSYRGVGISGTMSIQVAVNAHAWLGLACDTWMYGGGAHSNQSSDYFNFDAVTASLLSLEDLVGVGNVDELTRIGESMFRSMCQIGPEDPFPGHLKFAGSGFWLNNNFSIDSTGLFFFYNDYDIAAYAYGPTKLVIPWDSLATIVDSAARLAPFVEDHRK